MFGQLNRLAAATLMVAISASEVLAFHRDRHIPPGGGGAGGGSAPEIDGPAGLTAIALVACLGLYLYNRYRR